VDRQHDDPPAGTAPGRRDDADGLVLPPGDRGHADRGDQLHPARARGAARRRRGRRQGDGQPEGSADQGRDQ
jgi:hypothetical protein